MIAELPAQGKLSPDNSEGTTLCEKFLEKPLMGVKTSGGETGGTQGQQTREKYRFRGEGKVTGKLERRGHGLA